MGKIKPEKQKFTLYKYNVYYTNKKAKLQAKNHLNRLVKFICLIFKIVLKFL